MRSVGWIGLVYFLCLTFAIPLQLLMIYSNPERTYYYEAKGLFNVMGEFQVLLLFTLPVLLAVFLFRYMQVKLPADYIHSLPIRRETLYHQQVWVGALLLVVPVILTGLILFVLHGALDLSDFYSKSDIGQWMMLTCLWNLFIFLAGIFVAVFIGMSVLQGALTYILLFLPAGLIMLTFMNAQYFLYGFSVDYYLNQQVERLIPFIRASEMARQPLTGKEIAVYGLLIIFFYVVSLFIYKKRHIESATQAVAFKALQPVFQYGVTFCTMLVGGLYYGETQGDFGWILFGFISASLIGYFVAGMILQKTWRVFGQWKGYMFYALAMLVVGILLQMDVTGYENKQPELADVKRIYFSETLYP
jgi:ABC-2 type transport system permease protein